MARRNKRGARKGTTITREGYVRITAGPNRGRYEHQLVMEKKLGRRLRKGEIVHHNDGNGRNNAPGNLKLTDLAGHPSLHDDDPGSEFFF